MISKVDLDIMIDTNVVRLYDKPKDDEIMSLFIWLGKSGTMVVNKKLAVEYVGIGNNLLAGLINHLIAQGRYRIIDSAKIKSFKEDRHFNYTCNEEDRWHAKTVFLSSRKLLVSFDKLIVDDVNGFKKVDKVKPQATGSPTSAFYE